MKTIIYNLIDELTDAAYIEILKTLPSLKVEGIKNDDLVFYPLNIEAIRTEKRFLISGNKNAYKYLDDLDYLIEKILEINSIAVSREETTKNEN